MLHRIVLQWKTLSRFNCEKWACSRFEMASLYRRCDEATRNEYSAISSHFLCVRRYRHHEGQGYCIALTFCHIRLTKHLLLLRWLDFKRFNSNALNARATKSAFLLVVFRPQTVRKFVNVCVPNPIISSSLLRSFDSKHVHIYLYLWLTYSTLFNEGSGERTTRASLWHRTRT